ncbi:MAG: AAA family ATPase [Candidatus Brocadiae bacterium]|nr:AAA family ATPase [Candidatus Brocadiia bacterium]
MKISIPKTEIDKIIKEYGCTQEEATQAYIAAHDAANSTFEKEVMKNLGKKYKKEVPFEIRLYTPKEIKSHLDKYVIGQEEYKKRISIAAAYHFGMIKYLGENPDQTQVKRFRKKNTLIAGPSGSGKTYAIEVLGDFLQVPTLIVDATDYTEVGYVGKNSEDMVRELIDMAPGNNRKEQAEFIARNGGIIFIDEIDKKARDGAHIGQDISREGFQRSVLKLIERKSVYIDNPYSPVSQFQEAMELQTQGKSDKKEKMITTENILFILGGSFERMLGHSLESIIKKRLDNEEKGEDDEEKAKITGFNYKQSLLLQKEYKNYIKDAVAGDYIKFGLLPELVGRAPIRSFVNVLSKNDLVRIMQDTEDSILSQYKIEFGIFGIQIDIQQDAIEYVAEKAENKKTGARALVSIWESILTDFQFMLPGSNFTKITIDRKLCEEPGDVLLKVLEKSPFVDFIEGFKKEYEIELLLEESAQSYIEEEAKRSNTPISNVLKKMLQGATALNYMNYKGIFNVTKEMLQEEKYFDRLFIEWYKKQNPGNESETKTS